HRRLPFGADGEETVLRMERDLGLGHSEDDSGGAQGARQENALGHDGRQGRTGRTVEEDRRSSAEQGPVGGNRQDRPLDAGYAEVLSGQSEQDAFRLLLREVA